MNITNLYLDQCEYILKSKGEKFAGKLGNRMRDVYTDIEKARRDLEGQSLEASSTAQAVTFITIVQQCKKKVKSWG